MDYDADIGETCTDAGTVDKVQGCILVGIVEDKTVGKAGGVVGCCIGSCWAERYVTAVCCHFQTDCSVSGASDIGIKGYEIIARCDKNDI